MIQWLTGVRPWKCAAKYLYLCLTYFLIDSFKNESSQHRPPFQKHLKATAIHAQLLFKLMFSTWSLYEKMSLRALFVDNSNLSVQISFCPLLRHKATVKSSLCRNKRAKEDESALTNFLYRGKRKEIENKIHTRQWKRQWWICATPPSSK